MTDAAAPTVLLVEDEDLLQPVFETFLVDAGFDVVVAADGSEAVERIERADRPLAALVTDIRLGAGKTGWEVATRARELQPTVPVVYMTGDSAADWSAHCVPESVLIQKPFVAVQLVTAVSQLMNQSATLALSTRAIDPGDPAEGD